MLSLEDNMNNAQSILDLYWDGYLPVNPFKIAEEMGVTLIPECFNNYSGYFTIDEGKPTIYYNSEEAESRINFTIAHELGHYVNGDTDVPRDTNLSFDRYNHDAREVNANRFAAELLMPDNVVKHLINFERIYSLEKLADRFGVSTGAVHYRLVNLRLIDDIG